MKYRVLKTETNDFSKEPAERVTTSVVWEGSDIRALSEKYPRSKIFGADPLGHGSIEDGWIRWSFQFERETEGKWVVCNDPRIRLTQGLSDLEYEID